MLQFAGGGVDLLLNVVYLSENKGHGIARQCSLDNCNYEFVALMDSDDISVPNRFELQLNSFSIDETLDIIGGNIAEFVDTCENIVAYRNVPFTDSKIKKYMKKRCPFNQPTVMFRKSAVEKAGGYLEWFCNEDYYLWVRLALNGVKFANIDEVLLYFRINNNTYSRRGGLDYFLSETKLQKFMLDNKVIGFGRFLINVTERFILQVLMPNKIRKWVFKKFARESKYEVKHK